MFSLVVFIVLVVGSVSKPVRSGSSQSRISLRLLRLEVNFYVKTNFFFESCNFFRIKLYLLLSCVIVQCGFVYYKQQAFFSYIKVVFMYGVNFTYVSFIQCYVFAMLMFLNFPVLNFCLFLAMLTCTNLLQKKLVSQRQIDITLTKRQTLASLDYL